jgi:NTE family protein
MEDSKADIGPAPGKRKALVLSGGGGRGAFEWGVLERLDELGWRPDVLVGTSIGSMNAAVWAVSRLAGVKRMWEEIRTRDMHRFFRWAPWDSLFDRKPWQRTLKTYVDEQQLKQTAIPLYVVAMNIKTGHPVVYTNSGQFDPKKKMYHKVDKGIGHVHLLASSSIPYIYPTTAIGNDPCWDGALMYNSPLQPAVDSKVDQILIVLLSPYHDLHKPGDPLPPAPPGILGKVGYLLDLAVTATFENDFEQMRKINRRVREERTDLEHRTIEAALIGPKEWLSILDVIRYRRSRIKDLHDKGRDAVDATRERIKKYGWDSL